MDLIERPTPLPVDISVRLATFSEVVVLAVHKLTRAEFFDDTRESIHLRLDDDTDL